MSSTIKHKIKNSADTGSWRIQAPYLDKKKCIGCKTCVKYCPDACIAMKEVKKQGKKAIVANIDKKYCKGCGVCAQVCPVKAIDIK